jgi:N-acetyl-1-D-myo-inositol-2-amino-2-deoxy-alpha-D-glucopyranoside deacetylase
MSGLLAVHAHPDDETINSGATMARYADLGVPVTLVTCTRGELGEVIPPSLAHLYGSPDLAEFRVGELAAAMAALGVRDHRFLDAPLPARYVDSGMAYGPDGEVLPVPAPPAGAFALVPVEQAAELLAAVIEAVRPGAVVTYDPNGGYGHPDHVQAHQVTMRAVSLVPVPKVYWICEPDQATAVVDASAHRDAKVAAMRAHATQISVAPDGSSYALSNGMSWPISGIEHYRLVHGEPAGPFDAAGRELDLLAGTS